MKARDLTVLRQPSRSEAALEAQEAVAIAARGDYVARSGRRVSIADAIARAVTLTKEYRPEDPVDQISPIS